MTTYAPEQPRGKPCRKCGADNWMLRSNGVRECRPCHAARNRKSSRRHPYRALFYNARARAELAGVPFALEVTDVASMLGAAEKCVYCGRTLRRQRTARVSAASATLDRITPEYGYTLGNVVVACHGCNCAKAGHTPASLRDLAARIEAVMNWSNHGTDTRHNA